MKKVIGSIVTYNPKMELLTEAIESFLSSYDHSIVYIWDNSENDQISNHLKSQFQDRIHYYTHHKNYGFGFSHNQNFKLCKNLNFDYFCIVNPDVIIPKNTIPQFVSLAELNPSYGLFSGLIYGTDGALHLVHKKLPTFKSYVFDQINKTLGTRLPVDDFTFPITKTDKPVSIPILSGCFLFLTKSHYDELGGFDNKIFLYFEDYDISYRSYIKGKSLVDPSICIIHHWQRDSHRSIKLKLIHIRSGLYFYWKALSGKYRA